MTISVVIAEDQAMVRTGFRLILESLGGVKVVGEAVNGSDAVRVVRETDPDVVLMDIRMPVMNGLRATEILLAENPSLRVVIITTYDNEENVFAALRAGAVGFLLKDSSPQVLVDAVHNAVDGNAMLSPSVTVKLLKHFATGGPAPSAPPGASPLTSREMDVVRGVARGNTNAEIAQELGISASAVKARLSEAQHRLGLRNRTEVAVWAWQSRLVA
ncbi:response regulator transcription factor [Streptomyces sp. NBC_01497]|uniref:response regulator transcription factor n=1 Tax=Streptomyces sp. NBC_01497 TaxID=2903885 RepID=UPI002E30F1D1|nr:response regulator transcription factor [Streptomyces sp. NBC_01497]